MGIQISPQQYMQDSVTLAQSLLGCELVHNVGGAITAGIIVETEAYRQDDEASHSFKGKTKRNEVMFGPGGHAYIYFTYGMHHCFNVVAGTADFAEAVLIRALEPSRGIEIMQQRRKVHEIKNLCSGPGKLVQALSIQPSQNGISLSGRKLYLNARRSRPQIAATPRIGITRAADKPWRFIVAGSPYITSHRFNKGAVPLEV